MRRQVKPFVTEYRGSARRSKDGSTTDLQEATAPRARSHDPQRSFNIEPAEDTYEAAMRAADALFAPNPRREQVSAEDVEPSQHAVANEETVPATTKAEPAPRRILQALEEPEADRFATLEAERTPKRRGRKPGSKNKPKVGLGDDWAPDVFRAPNAANAEQPEVPSVPPSLAAANLEDAHAPEPSTHVKARNNRFGWRRTELRPGERWKRRLPKVAW